MTAAESEHGKRRAKPPDDPPARIDCRRCRSYYLTYDAAWPHACRAFSIRSRIAPSIEVERSSGRACERFEPRGPLR